MPKYGPKPRPMEDRFWEKVEKTKDCWLWKASKNNMGYGMFQKASPENKKLAHRVSWEIAFGDLLPDQKVLHTCDNPACVRPDHLFVGTMKDNTQDMVKKGRGRHQAHPGEGNGFAKLTWGMVRGIRKRWKESSGGVVLQAQLAEEYGVCFSNINHIVSGRTWKE